jgi:hypothetical protein
MTRKFMVIGLFAFLFAFSMTAFAEVSFDSQSGAGFVGKGDVQSAFGWNNAALQQNYSGVTFTFRTDVTYSATCTYITDAGTVEEETHEITDEIETDLTSYISSQARTRNQVTGFFLTGYSGEVLLGEGTPVVGAPCLGAEGIVGTWTEVDVINSTDIGLFVNYGSSSVQLFY